jgi:hypothetical protein
MRERYKGAVSADALLIASLPSRADQTNVAPADVRMTGHERGLSYHQGRHTNMTTWTGDELDKIGRAEEMELASLRRDGTLRKPVTVWVVRHGDDLYVRSGYGRAAAWFRGIQVRHEGHIKAGGVDKDVVFVDADHVLDDQIDAAYRSKYRRYGAQYVDLVVAPEARSTTIKLAPRLASS